MQLLTFFCASVRAEDSHARYCLFQAFPSGQFNELGCKFQINEFLTSMVYKHTFSFSHCSCYLKMVELCFTSVSFTVITIIEVAIHCTHLSSKPTNKTFICDFVNNCLNLQKSSLQ